MARSFQSSSSQRLSEETKDCESPLEGLHGTLTWGGCAAVLATYSVSSSTAFMPYIYGRLGYLVAPALQFGYMMMCAALQMKVLQISQRNPQAHNMASLGELVAGRWGYGIYQFLQISNQQLFMPCALLFVIKSLKQVVLPINDQGYIFSEDIQGILGCNVVWIFMVQIFALVAVNVQRRFGHAANICKVTCVLNALQIAFIIARVVNNPDDPGPKPIPNIPTHHGRAWAGLPTLSGDTDARGYWSAVFMALSSYCYGYVPCFIATEAMHEMKNKGDARKSLWSSTIGMYILYAIVGIGPVLAWGWERNYEVLSELKADFFGRGANLMLLIAAMMDFVITGISLNQRLQEAIDPGFNPHDWSKQACLKWFLYSLPSSTIAFLMLCFIPDLSTLVGLMTAFVVPFSQIIGPAVLTIMAARKGLLGYKLSLGDWVLFVCAFIVGALMLVVGGSSTIYTIFWKTKLEGNFFCDAVAG